MHYGFRFEAWIDGNATNLAKKAMDNMGVNYRDSRGVEALTASMPPITVFFLKMIRIILKPIT
jgi:hypothetical protein